MQKIPKSSANKASPSSSSHSGPGGVYLLPVFPPQARAKERLLSMQNLMFLSHAGSPWRGKTQWESASRATGHWGAGGKGEPGGAQLPAHGDKELHMNGHHFVLVYCSKQMNLFFPFGRESSVRSFRARMKAEDCN